MKALLRLIPLCILLLSGNLRAATQPQDWFREIPEMESRLTALTGLPFKHPVAYAVINRVQLRKNLDDNVRENLKPDDLRIQQAVLSMLGLVPKDFDLKTTMVDLVTEQAAAFYDYHKKKLFVLDNDPGPEARVALVHELAHALADQNFHLERFTRDTGRGDDSDAARLAVVEGQATWLMTAYMSNSNEGLPDAVLRDRPDLLTQSVSEYPVFAKAPLYIRVSLVFPYEEGLLFQDALYRRFGREAFSRVFRDAPVTTHQILHPEAYEDQPPPKLPTPPVPPRQHDHLRKQAEGTLGEIDLRVLLVEALGKAEGEAVAAHLSAASYAYYENKRKQNPVLAFATTWDSPEAARNFFNLYRKVLAKKWSKIEFTEHSDTQLEGAGDSSQFQVTCNGNEVSSLEGSLGFSPVMQ